MKSTTNSPLSSICFGSLILITIHSLCPLCPVIATPPPSFGGKIKHVIVLMFENRSFDHILGFLRQNRSDIDGCLPEMGLTCSNPLNSSNPDSLWVPVGSNAQYLGADPDHGCTGITLQLYGYGVNTTVDSYPAPMNGFIDSYVTRESSKKRMNDSGSYIMQGFDPERLITNH